MLFLYSSVWKTVTEEGAKGTLRAFTESGCEIRGCVDSDITVGWLPTVSPWRWHKQSGRQGTGVRMSETAAGKAQMLIWAVGMVKPRCLSGRWEQQASWEAANLRNRCCVCLMAETQGESWTQPWDGSWSISSRERGQELLGSLESGACPTISRCGKPVR